MSGEKKVVLGLVTTKRPELESKDAVIARIHEAAKYLPLDRLCLSPQCGFASCEIGNKLTEAQQWAKLAQAALSVADRAYVLETGKISLTGTGAELMASDAVRKAYLGG